MMRALSRAVQRIGGFSVTETASVMAGLSLLTATAAPNIQEYVQLAQLTKATGDVRVIVVSLVRLMNDVGRIGSGVPGQPPQLLVGPGQTPEAAGTDASEWRGMPDGARVQELAAHLTTNAAGYAENQWRGPYLEGLSADPWGCRYGANVGLLGNGTGLVTITLSAGADCVVDTPFRMTGLTIAGDDVVGLLSTGR